ncbi:MAG: hypothetical protein IJD84_00120 [Parabacteroides sp.]|nr:hypothetical protein [Parabacteroides sp.]
MMKQNYIFLSVLLLGMLCACSEEDALVPEEADVVSHFMPNLDDNSQEAELRRDFYSEENSYLLFNDTLYHELLGTDANGEPYYKTETLDILYSVGSDNTYENNHVYEYLSSYEEKEKAANFLQTYLLPHFGKQLRPFSWLLVNTIKYPLYEDVYEYPAVLSGERCIAVSVGKLAEMAEDEKLAFAQSLQINVLSGALASKREMDDFYAFGESLYEQMDFNYVFIPDYAYTCGFLNRKINPSTGMPMSFHPDKAADVNDFLLLVFNNTEEEVLSQFSGYPIVLKKYEIIKNLIVELGYVF